MTSPLRKKHPTTPPNTLRSILSKWALGTALGCGLAATTLFPAFGQEPSSPIERLKNRSAEQRWTELKESMQRPRRRPGHAPPRSTAMPAPPAPRSAEAVAPVAPQISSASSVDSNAEWRSADEPGAPVPTTVDRGNGLRPAPDVLPVAPLPMEPSATVTLNEPTDSASTDSAANGQPATRTGLVDTGSARPFPVALAEQTTPQPAPDVVDVVDKPAPDNATDAIQMPPVIVKQSLSPDLVFRPEGDGSPLLVPNPAAYQVAAETTQGTDAPGVTAQTPENGVTNRSELPDVPGGISPDPAGYLPPMPSSATPVQIAQTDVPPSPDVVTPVELPQQSDLYKFRSIQDIEPFSDYTVSGRGTANDPNDPRSRTPKVAQLAESGSVDRAFATTEFQWEASNVFHNPLYFEDVELERYGHTYHPVIQPAASIAKFGVQAIGLPYQIALNPVWKQQYPLGYYRPGDPAPPLFYQIPFNTRAATTAAGVYTGMIFIFP